MIFDDKKVRYEVECLPEDICVEGNAMCSGDADYDRSCEEKIFSELKDGNDWAWCTVKVTAKYAGIKYAEGTSYLGCCSYASEEDFKSGGYIEQMCDDARDELYAELEDIDRELDVCR